MIVLEAIEPQHGGYLGFVLMDGEPEIFNIEWKNFVLVIPPEFDEIRSKVAQIIAYLEHPELDAEMQLVLASQTEADLLIAMGAEWDDVCPLSGGMPDA